MRLVGQELPGDLHSTTDIQNFKTLCANMQQLELNHLVSQKPKLRCFQRFKNTNMSIVERYLKTTNTKSRSIFARLRLGCLRLLVKTGRFKGLRYESRLCVYCHSDKVEDEVNFACECPLCKVPRTALYTQITSKPFKGLNLTGKFDYLMSYEQLKTVNLVVDCWFIGQAQTFN